jgi:outer membrane lipoprotein SlyB
MANVQSTPRLHPLLAGAAGAVILASALAVAAIAGYLPGSKAAQGEEGPVTKTRSSVGIARPCTECGVVVDVREVTVMGKGTGVGAVAGGVAGAVIGHDIGDGSRAGTAVGAVLGGIAGHQIERSARSTKRYDVAVRMADGSVKTVSTGSPAWRPGDKVRLHNGTLKAA